MQPGDLNEVITFQRLTTTDNGGGGQIETWTDIEPVSWARVRPKSGNEQIRAMQVGSSQMYDIDLYSRRDITEADRIVRSNGDVLRIRSVAIETNAAFMSILAERVSP